MEIPGVSNSAFLRLAYNTVQGARGKDELDPLEFDDFIRDNATGFIFDHRANSACEMLRAKIDNVISNETLLARVAAAGYEKSIDYSPERVADEFLKDFDSVIRHTDV